MDTRMLQKIAFIASGFHLRLREQVPVRVKPKTLYLAQFQVRSESVSGGAVPDDEVQLDFCISSGKRDGHYSYMTEQTLRNYAEEAARGVPFVRDHTENLENQIGRTIAATYDETEKRVDATISMLRDTDDTPENMRVNEFIRRIERRYYDSVSVGFRDAKEVCRICNREIWDWMADDPCPHIPGRSYDGQICEYDVDDGHLRHVGLVTSGSNPESKLLDRSQWPDDLKAMKPEVAAAVGAGNGAAEPKTLLERDGQKYRHELIETAIKAGIRAEDNFPEQVWRERFNSFDAETIQAQTATWDKLGDARWGEGGRKTSPEPGATDASPLILPSYLFEL